MWQISLFSHDDLFPTNTPKEPDGESLAVRDRLLSDNPQYHAVEDFQILCKWLCEWINGYEPEHWPSSSEMIVPMAELVRTYVVPSAIKLPGFSGERLLGSMALKLADAYERARLRSPSVARRIVHLLLKGKERRSALRVIESIRDSDRDAEMLRWLAIGYRDYDQWRLALRSLLRHAWLSPQHTASLISRLQNRQLLDDWNEFRERFSPRDATWFPAWHVTRYGQSSPDLTPVPEGDGPAAYRLIHSLLEHRGDGLSSDVLHARARLRDLDKEFLSYYLEVRGLDLR